MFGPCPASLFSRKYNERASRMLPMICRASHLPHLFHGQDKIMTICSLPPLRRSKVSVAVRYDISAGTLEPASGTVGKSSWRAHHRGTDHARPRAISALITSARRFRLLHTTQGGREPISTCPCGRKTSRHSISPVRFQRSFRPPLAPPFHIGAAIRCAGILSSGLSALVLSLSLSVEVSNSL